MTAALSPPNPADHPPGDPPFLQIKDGDRLISLVGLTDHDTADLEAVDQKIAALNPDTVCVALCETRFKILTDDLFWRRLKVIDVLRQGRFLMLLGNVAAAWFQHRQGKDVAVRLGQEMLARMEVAQEMGAKLVFGERDLQVTLKRSWRELSPNRRAKTLLQLLRALVWRRKPDSLPAESMHGALRAHLPEVAQPFFDESDQYLMDSIRRAEGDHVVALIPAERLAAVARHFETPVDRDALAGMPQPPWWVRVFPWMVSALLIGLLVYGFFGRGDLSFREILLTWAIPNWLCTGLFMLPARPTLAAFTAGLLVTPFTVLSPLLRTAVVVGLVEGWRRRPRVTDCERIPIDLSSVRGIYANPLTRTLLVVVMSHLGSNLGNYVGAFLLFRLLT
ncbi:hypothetical protein [Acanthopleuribacter pedis]|uniref:TraB family protein n=1 Tax=Acanthopleuribacter pedis TaxID=442870 RepID=A0A8J7QCW6_9BACT|nr:hypothetical protein [Acanthopleuribacter pedis]MBO1317240.1 hypothetical protein [Acanthopleuribacter pedis]MBO1318546.1 hypothetical protein [Acanthopleuribacter pedis]